VQSCWQGWVRLEAAEAPVNVLVVDRIARLSPD
jgi:hypothetical protein